jgi:simple sugar transport system permease protein
VPVALLIALAAWFVMSRTVFGFEIRAVGRAPQAARHAGFDADRTVWTTLMIGGGVAGLAGVFEAAGPFGQMTPQFPVGYGFTAIIVAFLGRLHPVGVLLAGIVMAVTLRRRRDRAGAARPAGRGGGAVPGDDALLPARRRRADAPPPPPARG